MATEIIFLFNHRWLVFSKTSENTRPDALTPQPTSICKRDFGMQGGKQLLGAQ